MKKILLILVLCLSTIGLAGCGNSAPTQVTLDPKNGEYQMLEVGKDIAEGNYTVNEEIMYDITTQGTSAYDTFKTTVNTQKWSGGPGGGSKGTTFTLSKGEYLFLKITNPITLSKN